MRTIEEIKVQMAVCDHDMKSEHPDVATRAVVEWRHMRRDALELVAQDIPLDRLEEICNAEREGRVVVLPCKVFDSVWTLEAGVATQWQIYSFNVTSRDTAPVPYMRFCAVPVPICDESELDDLDFWDSDVGESVFLTRAAAEAALHDTGRDREGRDE